jgi:hypothetical protein
VKGAVDQVSDMQRQLKSLSEQTGALAARVDSLEKIGNPIKLTSVGTRKL